MSHLCKVRIKKVTYETPEICPFMVDKGLRELARLTGLDVGYLSRVQSGKISITPERLTKLLTVGEGVKAVTK